MGIINQGRGIKSTSPNQIKPHSTVVSHDAAMAVDIGQRALTFQTTHAISRIFNVHSQSRKTTMVCL